MNLPSDRTEKEWVEALRAGDEAALRDIFNQYYPAMLRAIYRYVPDESVCKDLAQEVFVELWKKRSELNIHSSLGAYLRRAAVNRALNHIKAEKRFAPDPWGDNRADTSAAEIEQKSEMDSLESALKNAIEQLPEKCRVVFVMSRFDQMSHKEIAAALDISVKTIENQITKAMKTLRDILRNHTEMSLIVILIEKWFYMT